MLTAQARLRFVGTIQHWDYESAVPDEEYSYDGYADKVKFGWTCSFQENVYLQFSLSHQVVAGEFGGGNVQLMILF